MVSEKKSVCRKAQCAKCAGERNCDILGHHEIRGSDGYLDWTENWYILQCRGCEHVFCQTSSTNSEDYDHYHDEYGEEAVTYHETLGYWPALLKRKRPEWFEHSSVQSDKDKDGTLSDALKKMYGALDNDLKVLSAIGVRTSFDIASELLGIDASRTFAQKLDDLVSAGHIGTVDRGRIETLIDAGSASAHRGWKPSEDDINVMLDVLEHFIFAAFVEPERRADLDKRAAAVKSKVPSRKKATKPKAAKTAAAKPAS